MIRKLRSLKCFCTWTVRHCQFGAFLQVSKVPTGNLQKYGSPSESTSIPSSLISPLPLNDCPPTTALMNEALGFHYLMNSFIFTFHPNCIFFPFLSCLSDIPGYFSLLVVTVMSHCLQSHLLFVSYWILILYIIIKSYQIRLGQWIALIELLSLFIYIGMCDKSAALQNGRGGDLWGPTWQQLFLEACAFRGVWCE